MSLTDSLRSSYKKWSTITKVFCLLLIAFYFLSFFAESTKMLAITPGYFMPPNYYVWTLFTFIFFENHFYCVVIDLVTLFFSNTLLEPLWGQRELIKYLFIVIVTSGLICFFICYFLYLSTLSVQIIFHTHIHGMIAYSAAITVAVRQTLPEEVFFTLPVGNVKNQHLSFICLIVVALMAILKLVDFVYPCLFISGVFVSWIYLRYLQKHENGDYGDHSESFEFARFFPNHLSPPVSIASSAVHSLLVRMRICSSSSRRQHQQPHQLLVVSSDSDDSSGSSRRKQMALRALSDRLAHESQSTASAKETRQPLTPKPPSPTHKALSSAELRHLPVPDFKPASKQQQQQQQQQQQLQLQQLEAQQQQQQQEPQQQQQEQQQQQQQEQQQAKEID